jgi:hypothetical protein
MPAGSGPQCTAVSGVAIGTSEAVVATLAPANFNNPNGSGNLVQFEGSFTPPATASTLTLKIRQGTTAAGTQVGATYTQAFAVSTPGPCSIIAVDASAFANQQQGGQYVITASYTVTGGTLTGVAELETVSPII